MKKTLLLLLICGAYNFLSGQEYRLVNPKDNYVTSSTTINFQWSAVDATSHYDLQISLFSDFSSTVGPPHDDIPANNIQVTTLSILTTYYWRIRVHTPQNTAPWSYSRNFTIFSPTQFNGLAIWFDAAQNVTQSAGNISAWGDLSPSGLNAVQNSAANKPILIGSSTELCGRPVVRFNGNASASTVSYLSFANQTFADFTACMVRSYNNNSNYMQYVIAGINNGLCAESDYYSSGYGIYASNGGLSTSTTGVMVPGFGVYTTSATDNGQTGHVYRNGIAPPLAHNDHLNGLSLNALGTRTDAYILAYKGDIGELVLYNNALDSADQSMVERYLRYKFAPPVDLGPDIIYNQFCVNVTLGAIGGCYNSYLWSSGATTATISPTSLGTYWVRATDNLGYVSTDTINIRPQLAFNQLQDSITFCYGDSVVWNTGYPSSGFQFTWSTSENTPSITIHESGDYYVNIKDGLNCYLYSDTVHVFADPFSSFTLGADTSICSGNRLNFMYPDSQLTSILWSTGDTITEPVINNAGDYSVTAVNWNGCEARDTIHVTIKGIAPTVDFSNPILCSTDTIAFNNLSAPPAGNTITDWLWTFGDDSTSIVEDPTHVFLSPGQHTVTLTATTDSDCVNTISKILGVYLKPVARFQAEISCALAPTRFNDLSSTQPPAIDSLWKWHFSSSDTSILQYPSFAFPAPGKYEVSLLVTNSDGCTDFITDSIEVFAPFSANFSFTNVCLGDSTTFTDHTESLSLVSWFWDTGDNFFSNKKIFKHKFAAAGTDTITLRIENSIGCVDTTTRIITIYKHPVAAFTDMVICEDQQYSPLDSSVVFETNNTWKWNIDGSSYNGPAPHHYFADTGSYTVKLTVTSESGCKDSTTREVYVAPNPIAAFSFTPAFGDAPLTATFHNESINADSYLWNFGDGVTDVVTDPVHTYFTNNTYQITLIAINEFGCRDSVSKTITAIHTDLDIAVNYVITESAPQPDGTVLISVKAGISNVESRRITWSKLYATIGSGGVISEDCDTVLEVGQGKVYPFKAHFVVAAANANSYVCVEAVSVNHGEQETRLDNNQACNSINGVIQIIGPSPNPSNGSAYLGLILPKPGKVWIEIVDVIGQVAMREIELDLPVGRTDYEIPVKMLRHAEYFIRIKHNDDKLVKKLMVLKP